MPRSPPPTSRPAPGVAVNVLELSRKDGCTAPRAILRTLSVAHSQRMAQATGSGRKRQVPSCTAVPCALCRTHSSFPFSCHRVASFPHSAPAAIQVISLIWDPIWLVQKVHENEDHIFDLSVAPLGLRTGVHISPRHGAPFTSPAARELAPWPPVPRGGIREVAQGIPAVTRGPAPLAHAPTRAWMLEREQQGA